MKLLPKLAVLGCGLVATTALAADHQDSPTLAADPTTDITDVFTWMDGNNVALVLNVNPAATSASKFSDAALYTFHTSSTSAFGMPGKDTDIIVKFDATQKVQVWVGSNPVADYVAGDPSANSGLSSADGKLKVYAGLRDDPFFFNLDGFKDVVTDIANPGGTTSNNLPLIPPQPAFTFDAAGCPNNIATNYKNALGADLTHTMDGTAAPADHFAGLNVLSIVLNVDKSLLTTGGPVMSVWASTNKAM